MFTGIIQAIGTLKTATRLGVDTRLTLHTGKLSTDTIALGDSIAVNGVCLTATAIDANTFSADVSAETLAHTTLGSLDKGAAVNLELALTPETRLGGHLVSGHVDGVGELLSITPDGVSQRMRFSVDPSLAHYVARKGSICINGVSLTVNAVADNTFDVNLVPHTLQETILDSLEPGAKVNIEVDIIARYLERLLTGGMPARDKQPIDEQFLADSGILST